MNVVGGRVSGIGVAGFTLGGGMFERRVQRTDGLTISTGYSWLTNQHGLTVDTVQTFELVMANGTAIM